MHLPVDVFSDLVVKQEGTAFTVQGDGKVISIAFPDVRIAIKAFRAIRATSLPQNNVLSLLKILDINLDVLVYERPVLKLGPGITPNVLSRLFGISDGCLSLKNLALSLMSFFKKK